MLCPGCSHENPDANRYCGMCGTPLRGGQRVARLRDLLEAGILKADAALWCRVRGQQVFATLKDDGRIEHDSHVYDSPVAAIEAVRGGPCDSWFCWHTPDPQSERDYPIAHFRAAWRRIQGG